MLCFDPIKLMNSPRHPWRALPREKLPLVPAVKETSPTPQTVREWHGKLALTIGTSHAAVAASLRLGTVVLAHDLGAQATAADRLMHGVGALLLAPAALAWFGAKNTITVAMVMFCVQVMCHFSSYSLGRDGDTESDASNDNLMWALAIAGAVFEGIGSAWLWTAQGAYLGHCAGAITAITNAHGRESCESRDGMNGIEDGCGGGGCDSDPRSESNAEENGVPQLVGSSESPLHLLSPPPPSLPLSPPAAAPSSSNKAVVAETPPPVVFAHATAVLSGDFGLRYLGVEVALGLLTSAIMTLSGGKGTANSAVYALFFGLALGAALLHHVWVPPESKLKALKQQVRNSALWPNATAPNSQERGEKEGQQSGGALRSLPVFTEEPPPAAASSAPLALLASAWALLARRDRRLLSLLPFQVAYGLSDAVHVTYVNAFVASRAIGVSNLGVLSAVLVGSAAALSPPLGRLGALGGVKRQAPAAAAGGKVPPSGGSHGGGGGDESCGKRGVLLGGLLCLVAKGAVLLVVPSSVLVGLGWGALLPLYFLQGAGRAVYETTNKALIADTFGGGIRPPEGGGGGSGGSGEAERVTAFSVTIFASGVSTAMGLVAVQGAQEGGMEARARFATWVCVAFGILHVAVNMAVARR